VNLTKRLALPLLNTLFSYRDTGMRLQLQALHAQLKAKHILVSAVSSLHDSPGPPNDFLLTLGTRLIERSRREELPLLRERDAPEWVFCWPGEHYRVLASGVSLLRPRTIVEIGTNTGLSTLAMYPRMPLDGRLWTFDIVPWNQVRDGMGRQDGSFLRDSDFEDGRLSQIIGDLGCAAAFHQHREILCNADLIFVDGPKDGLFESRLLRNFEKWGLRKSCVVIFDDIRYWTMLALWRAISRPKLDITSFGHFAGTGLVVWE
jgi:predicted O-methyltransferase YrrM